MQPVNMIDQMPWEGLISEGAVTDANMACTETLFLSLKCFSALLSLPSTHRAKNLHFLGELLGTYCATAQKDNSGKIMLNINLSETGWHSTLEAPKLTDLVQLVKKSFSFVVSFMRGPEGVLDHDLLVIKILWQLSCLPDTVLSAAGVSDVGILEHLPTHQRRVRSLCHSKFMYAQLSSRAFHVAHRRCACLCVPGNKVRRIIYLACVTVCPFWVFIIQCLQDVQQMKSQIAAAAKSMLWTRWDGKVFESGGEASSEIPSDVTWKQRPSQDLAGLISLFLSSHGQPEEVIAELSTNHLASVKAVTGESANCMFADLPSLSTATFPTWYRYVR